MKSQHPEAAKKDHCERCGFIPEHRAQLDLHRHREPDAETLCANCHRLVTATEFGFM